jgi:hypothetical protein
MTTIGGKHRKPKLPSHPQVVIQWAPNENRYAKIGLDEIGCSTIAWIGDPSAATKFESKYAAKSRIRDLIDIPDSRVFLVLESA